MHTITLVASTALLKNSSELNLSAKIEQITNFTDVIYKNKIGDVIVVHHTHQTIHQLEQLLNIISQISQKARIIIISAQYTTRLAILCYKKGADFCTSESLGVASLPYIIKRLLQMLKLANPELISYNNIQLNMTSGILQISKTKIYLRRKEAQILSCLLGHKNQTVSRSTLINYVWSQDFIPCDTTLDVYIRRLRIKLKKYSHIIETVRGFGYKANLNTL